MQIYSTAVSKMIALQRRIIKKIYKTPDVALNVSLSRACNAKCNMCPMHNQNNYLSTHMDDKTFQKTIQIFNEIKFKYMILHGMGECLLHPRFKEYMDQLEREHFLVRISSNGYLLNRHMDTLLKKNIDFFRVSTEGWDNESMMKYRGQEFDRVYRNVKEFYRYHKGKKTRYQFFLSLHIYPSMTEDNIRQMFDLWGECAEHIQVRYPLNPSLNHEKAGPPAPVPEEGFGDYYHMVPRKIFTCTRAMKGAYIQPNGDVLPCCEDYSGHLKYGNIHDEDFMDIFTGKRAISLREEFKSGDPKSCGKCFFFYEFAPGMEKEIARLQKLVPARHANRFDFH